MDNGVCLYGLDHKVVFEEFEARESIVRSSNLVPISPFFFLSFFLFLFGTTYTWVFCGFHYMQPTCAKHQLKFFKVLEQNRTGRDPLYFKRDGGGRCLNCWSRD